MSLPRCRDCHNFLECMLGQPRPQVCAFRWWEQNTTTNVMAEEMIMELATQEEADIWLDDFKKVAKEGSTIENVSIIIRVHLALKIACSYSGNEHLTSMRMRLDYMEKALSGIGYDNGEMKYAQDIPHGYTYRTSGV